MCFCFVLTYTVLRPLATLSVSPEHHAVISQLVTVLFQLSKSTDNQVELLNVQPALSGNFSCEVSADAPSFSTAFVSHLMTVVGE